MLLVFFAIGNIIWSISEGVLEHASIPVQVNYVDFMLRKGKPSKGCLRGNYCRASK
jgi:hypothetical protein